MKIKTQRTIKAVLTFDVLQFFILTCENYLKTKPACEYSTWGSQVSRSSLASLHWHASIVPDSLPLRHRQQTAPLPLQPCGNRGSKSDSCSDPSFVRGEYWGSGDQNNEVKEGCGAEEWTEKLSKGNWVFCSVSSSCWISGCILE